MSLWLTSGKEAVLIKVLVQPRASKNGIAGVVDDYLKIRLTAPPVDNAANEQCIKYLAEVLDLPRRQLTITHGHTGRRKTLSVSGLSAEEIERRLIKVK